MTSLREEMRAYLQRFGISDPFDNDDVWTAFVAPLTSVLQDQPIVRPHPAINQIRYEMSAPGSAVLVVSFRDKDKKPARVANVC